MKRFLSLLIFIALLAGGWFIFSPPASDAEEKLFTIEKGEGVNEISQNLEDSNFIRNKFVFETYVWWKKIQSNFQAGEHKLKQNMYFWEIAEVLTKTSGPEERDIKTLEGWNNREIAEYLEKENVINSEAFFAELDKRNIDTAGYDFLEDRPEGATLEGYLFPDTYRIYKTIPLELLGESVPEAVMAEHIVKKMMNNFGEKLAPELREEITKQKKTIFEIVTMASIIEKEARGEDMAMVADIFWRRIDEGIALQSDATVNYATGKYETQPSLDDLEVDSPYNTYKYRGLPEGPIGNPGIEAIKAAIYPEVNNYWYFLHTKDGEIIYGKNFDEHKANKAKYLQ